MDKVLVLGHSKPYDFKGSNGEDITGVKVSFINSQPNNEAGVSGYLPMQLTLDPAVLSDFKELPGIYEVAWGLKPGKNSQPVATINSFKFIKVYKIEL